MQQVLDKNFEEFSRYVPVDAMLPILKREKILDDRDVTNIGNKPHKQDRINSLFEIFHKHSSGIDLLTFCQLLQKQGKRSTQEFGRKMEAELTQSTS